MTSEALLDCWAEQYPWVGDAADVSTVIDAWFNFGRADGPVIEL